MVMRTFRETTLAIMSEGDEPMDAVLLTLEYMLDGGKWTGECLELGTAAFSDTSDDVRGQLVEAVELQLNEVHKLGFIDQFLKNHGLPRRRIRPGSSVADRGWTIPEPMGA